MLSSAYDRLISTTKKLLWEKGYESTSPKDIQKLSEVGQGSFYHHFSSKKKLAIAALEETLLELSNGLENLTKGKNSFEKIEFYLTAPRDALRGCKLGRLAMEKSVIDDQELIEPLVKYFEKVTKRLENILKEGQDSCEFKSGFPVHEVASSVIAIVQGGYVLSRIMKSSKPLESATNGALVMLKSLLIHPKK